MKLSIPQRKQAIINMLNKLYSIACEITFRNNGAFTVSFAGHNEIAAMDIRQYLLLNGGSVEHNYDCQCEETYIYYQPSK